MAHKNGRADNFDKLSPVESTRLTGSEIRDICTGTEHSLILKSDGELLAFGGCSFGQTGLGSRRNIFNPNLVMKDPSIKSVCCGTSHSMVLKENGEVWVWGWGGQNQLGLSDKKNRNIPTLLTKSEDAKAIYSGGSHSLLLKSNGEVWVWGNGEAGQLVCTIFLHSISSSFFL